MVTLLPNHKNNIQKALDVLSGERFESLDLSVISILPLSCPAQILPHLAQSFDVDISGLDEAQTRELLQDAFQIHYYAGTPYAINRALQIIFKNARIEEWFTYGGEPYYFRITAEISPDITGLNGDILAKLIKTANRYKNARSLLEGISIALELKGYAYIGQIALSGKNIEIQAGTSGAVESAGELLFACAKAADKQTTIEYRKTPEQEIQDTLYAALGVVKTSEVTIYNGDTQ
ncbi:MAG: phage tail protein I [Campylobacteraceae bacterium]|jgi:phage tail P2-like protein|nr:phage tail protein I [Campylobacteraceae bacterium]